ncbi:GNAT family N-acetyltransferase [Flavobacterium frigidarium]|uniref:GNAT family N-acetyltransferase n=1 Tax=Flavobacterium frigidarium TaxID=99286 RepID=UPI000407F004|nr:GNAT family N-acetyltransferase [Flavobacterium frigidarium]
MNQIVRTTPDNIDFKRLIELLDIDIQERDGDEHVFFAQFNKTDSIKNAVVVYVDEVAVGCGAFKLYKDEIAEIKRMYVDPQMRGKGIASKILIELENWAREEGYTSAILETGHKFPEAVALYQKNGFVITENYGQYIGVADSICFRKDL